MLDLLNSRLFQDDFRISFAVFPSFPAYYFVPSFFFHCVETYFYTLIINRIVVCSEFVLAVLGITENVVANRSELEGRNVP